MTQPCRFRADSRKQEQVSTRLQSGTNRLQEVTVSRVNFLQMRMPDAFRGDTEAPHGKYEQEEQ